ncbi:MAG: helix-turn-helix domain-containing protein [Candidatus Latescibacterota bacterium]
MRQDISPDIQWLTLSEAAKQLHIHPTTLRRWADEGKIPFMLTPGGHRRFAAPDIAQLTIRHHGARRLGPVEKIWANRVFENARKQIPSHQHDKWLTQEDPEVRNSNRSISLQLMELILEYLSVENEPDTFVSKAQQLGGQFGTNAKKGGLTLVEVLKASMLFRDILLASALQLPENIHIPRESLETMLRRMSRILNAVQVGIAEQFTV